jgi:hypothetical protein
VYPEMEVCISVFLFTPHRQDFSDMYHTVCPVILVYRCNNQVSNVGRSDSIINKVSEMLNIIWESVVLRRGISSSQNDDNQVLERRM